MTLPFIMTQRTGMILYSLLLTLIALGYLYAGWQWYSDWELIHAKVAANTGTANVDMDADALATIPNSHLFGQSLSKDQMPITNLQLKVTGIVKVESAKNAGYSKAYISTAGAPSKIFVINDTLPDGVKIYEIATDAVILEINGHLEKLPLPRAPLQFKERKDE